MKQKLTRKEWVILGALVALGVIAAPAAMAGADTTFDSITTQFQGYLSGSGGKLAAILALGMAVIGSVFQFNIGRMLGAVGIGAAVGLGPGIVTAGITALI